MCICIVQRKLPHQINVSIYAINTGAENYILPNSLDVLPFFSTLIKYFAVSYLKFNNKNQGGTANNRKKSTGRKSLENNNYNPTHESGNQFSEFEYQNIMSVGGALITEHSFPCQWSRARSSLSGLTKHTGLVKLILMVVEYESLIRDAS